MSDQKFFKISLEGEILKVGFGDPAQNDQIVKEAEASLKDMIENGTLSGGSVLKINGPASLPVAVAIAHAVAHRYETVAVFDPKLGKYVVAICHSDKFSVGDLID